ncbi:MAG: hypothetical protein QNJ78_07110 [Gammaproteobacteria bacterium]|nr:hypothetical protein [Gammaproteobacteria bacterium]
MDYDPDDPESQDIIPNVGSTSGISETHLQDIAACLQQDEAKSDAV